MGKFDTDLWQSKSYTALFTSLFKSVQIFLVMTVYFKMNCIVAGLTQLFIADIRGRDRKIKRTKDAEIQQGERQEETER